MIRTKTGPRTQTASSIATTPNRFAAPSRMPVVLVVDDMELVRTILRGALMAYPVEIRTVASGREAVQFLRETRDEIDMVLLDMQMDDMDGLETWEQLRALRKNLRCCFMTGYCRAAEKNRMRRLGAECVFDKPFNPDLVAMAVWKMVRPRPIEAAG